MACVYVVMEEIDDALIPALRASHAIAGIYTSQSQADRVAGYVAERTVIPVQLNVTHTGEGRNKYQRRGYRPRVRIHPYSRPSATGSGLARGTPSTKR
jgi:hypothetical protein